MAEKMTTEIKLAIQKGFVDASTTVNKHTAEVIGNELGGAIEDAKKLTGAMLSPLAAAFKKDDVPKEDKERNSLLTEMVDYFAKQEAAAGRKFDPKEKKSPWYKLLIGVGLIVGGIAGALLLPFTLLWKGLMTIKPIAVFFGKIGRYIAKTQMYKYFDDLMMWFKKLPVLGKFISAFKTGFRFLAWPIQVILSAIDFIKGFAGTEGDIIAKIKGGLLNVIKGFIDLPVKLFGWIADWFLGLFDIKVKGGSAKVIMDNVMQFAGIFIDNIIEFFSMILEGYKLIWQFIGPSVIQFIKNLGTYFLQLWEDTKVVIGAFQEFGKITLTAIGEFFAWLKPALVELWTFITSPVKILMAVVDWIKGNIAQDMQIIGKVKTVFDEIVTFLIDWIFSLFSWIPGIDKVKKKVTDFIGVQNEPTKEVDAITQSRKTAAATYATRQATKEEMAMRAQKETTKELARGNIATMKTAAAITNNNRVEYTTEPIADETDNKLMMLQQLTE